MKKLLCLVLFGLMAGFNFSGPAQAQENAPDGAARTPVMVEGKSALPLRVLTRPMSSLYQAADEKSAVVQGNLPAFSNFFVYTRPVGEQAALGQGWYEVGLDDKGQTAGWLKADDVFEWKQTMCLAYTNPHDRSPVLMFDGSKPLENLIQQSAEERGARVQQLYDAIESKNIAADFPVLSVEPKLAVDWSKNFYLLPILDFKAVEIDNRPGRLLELAAVTAGGEKAREKSDIRTNAAFLDAATITPDQAVQQKGEDLAIDFVWVIDTTLSMGPYIERVTALIADASNRIAANPEINQRLKFGVWGYRDPVADIPAIEYDTKNFTPELQSISDFLATMGQVKDTQVDSVDFPEDMFSGVNDALYSTAWRPNSLRIMVLVGDAPGHEMGHDWNLSGKNAEALRVELSEKKVSMFAVQIRPNGARRYQRIAEDQFRVLAQNKGVEEAAYIDVTVAEPEGFSRAVELILNPSVALIQNALALTQAPAVTTAPAAAASATAAPQAAAPAQPMSGELAALLEDDMEEVATTDKEKEAMAVIENSLQAAMVDWLGSETEAQPPRDIVAWVMDKDLIDSSKSSLEVRLLINKRQLDSLRGLLAGVIEAGRRSSISGDDFFTSMKAASSIVVRDPDKLADAASIQESGLVPEFLDGLPYQSRLMAMNNELWNSLSSDEQDNFISALEANVKAYQSIHDEPERWIALNEGAEADEMVYPLPLELLP
ncbi:MAG: VWA domain-containing protein [Candidatus Adiutrix sp.]|jgi:hypothetical protein|nr:VWA domain-containing protein [Candidatus Adiutrix sp.]